jgi:SAM-dependent methyltransferase
MVPKTTNYLPHGKDRPVMSNAKQNEEAARSAKTLYTAKATLYQFLFVQLIGYGLALDAFFTKRNLIGPGMKVLDAGCGTGLLTKIHYRLVKKHTLEGVSFFAFDLTPRMLGKFKAWIAQNQAQDEIELYELNVLKLYERPAHWNDFDVVVTSTMLEYIPRTSLPNALKDLIALLKPGGRFVLCITRCNILTKWLIGAWWKSNLYTKSEIGDAFDRAGAANIRFHSLSGLYRVLSSSIIVAEYQKDKKNTSQYDNTALLK